MAEEKRNTKPEKGNRRRKYKIKRKRKNRETLKMKFAGIFF
jgi:hypothetical protein